MKILPALLNTVRDLRDRSCKMSFITRELTNDEFSELRGLRGMEGWLLFGKERMSKSDIPKGTPETGNKSPAQRMRSVFYLLWKQEHDADITKLNDREFYEQHMEMLITSLKNKLD